MLLKEEELFRYPNAKRDNEEWVDELRNFINITKVSNFNSTFRSEKGIHFTQSIKLNNGNDRVPVIIISITSWKAGSEQTPWKDRIDNERGYVTYYGDNKPEKEGDYPGNKFLADELIHYTSSNMDKRISAIPIIIMERPKKGFIIFRGLGVIENMKKITQLDANGKEFVNYEYEFALLSLLNENNKLDWEWINKRCDPNLSDKDTIKYAPKSWQEWIKNGNEKIERYRKNIAKIDIISENDQKIENGSFQEKIINEITNYYENKPHRFELFAKKMVEFIFKESNIKYHEGWVTQGSGDKGIDFVLRMDVGNDLAGIKIVTLGQAKCFKPGSKVNAVDLARTVAKLKRGWIGAFVTTTSFTIPMQEEVIEDKYPLILVNGKKIVEIVEKHILKGTSNLELLKEYIEEIDSEYEISLSRKDPEDILYK